MKNRWIIWLISLWLIPVVGMASPVQVDQVLIDGNRRVERGYIEGVLTVAPGTSVTVEEIDRNIEAIFKTGRFQDVSAELVERDGKKALVFKVSERPLLRKINFTGNSEIKSEKLGEMVNAQKIEFYRPQVVRDATDIIKRAYVQQGYYATEIDAKVDINERQEATITFNINEGDKVYVTNIRFEGNTVFKAKQLKKAMLSKEKWFLSFITGRGGYNEEMTKVDRDIIADQYYNEGYIQVRVKGPVANLLADKKSMELLYEIEEGPQFFAGKMDVSGDLLKDKQELLGVMSMKEGDVFSRKVMREDMLKLNDQYADTGFAYVNVTPETEVNEETRRVDITFDVEQGIRARIGRINVAGNTRTRDKVIRRQVKLAEGDVYSASLIKDSRRKINNLGYFDEVNLTTRKGDDLSLMDVDIDVKERATGSFSIGAGFSSVDGLMLQGSVSQDNFLGRGLRLDLSGSLGGSRTVYRIGLLDPYFLDRDLALGFDLYDTEREWTDFERETTGGDIKLGLPITDDIRSFFVYRYEKKNITDVDDDASWMIKEQEGKHTLSSFTASLSRNTTDFRPDPSRGNITEIAVEYAGLGGTERFIKYTADHRFFYPLPWNMVFSIHGQLGYIQEMGDKSIPLDERFFLGGMNSLRGFESREVGPRDPETGDFYGGAKEAVFNFELTFPLLKEMKMKGLLFFDTGNAWDTDESMFSEMRYSVGAGISWNSPMGPLRFAWGYNLDPEEWEEPTAFDFSVGRMF
ncbi:outer membrane protein assembly factor BamA [Syntrophotalea acetylenica]|uniref:Outer membrane protein assembly factor BamA n=1 Tax=Syntrophotalea acetylenica TaxID=29542 RepID=A0A1L3GHQ9_SYNAC|nr:outer membrane protein assembly factor BamA [Syntrophotalea acetylenica]APG25484.1 outer membrane protein assembly factor BamA [Syntrophotalea acetylenica]APG43549.1 outer membrane protein assembly factor BamA [Syntrophotalea acetylenica]MDY0262055.1 outer membrane protein assembly factor BamA [Syntrophotalea acetylenica]